MERASSYIVIVFLLCSCAIILPPPEVKVADKPVFQSAGSRWGSSHVWSRYKASQRSFRYKGVNHRGISEAGSYSIFNNTKANRGVSVRSNLPASQRTVKRSYGYKGRYSSSQRITHRRKYRGGSRIQRGATIGVRR